MRITTTYFGPAELKNLYITTSRDWQRMYRTIIQSGKLSHLLPAAQIAIDLYIFNYGLLWILTTGTCTRADIHQCKLQFIIRRQSPELQLS